MKTKILQLLVAVVLIFTLFAASQPVSAGTGYKLLYGTLKAVDTTASTITVTPKNGTDVVLTVDAATILKRASKTAVLADLQMGDKITAYYDPATMLAKKVYARPDLVILVGTVKAVDGTAGTVTVTPKKTGMADVVLKVDANTVVRYNGKLAAITDFEIGGRVDAVYNRGTFIATRIYAMRIPVKIAWLYGTVKAVDTTANTVTITPKTGGDDVTLTVDTKTVIKRNGKVAAVADLVVGDAVVVKYDKSHMLALSITALRPEVKGTVKAVDTTANTITVTPEMGGADVTLTVDANTMIYANGMGGTLADISVGDWVIVTYDSTTMLAARIIAHTPFVMGQIAAIDATAMTLTVTPSHGQPDVALKADANTKVSRDFKTATFADLKVGDWVYVQYDPSAMLAKQIDASSWQFPNLP